MDEHGVHVRTRSGRRPADPLPELAPLADLNVPVVLDGELVAGGGRMEDFGLLSRQLLGGRRNTAVALMLVAFDLLWVDGDDITTRDVTGDYPACARSTPITEPNVTMQGPSPDLSSSPWLN